MGTENFRPRDGERDTIERPPSDAGTTSADGFTEFCEVWKIRCEGPRCNGNLVTESERERCGCVPEQAADGEESDR
jgi:hypothetical protein